MCYWVKKIYAKYSDKQIWENSVDIDQTAPRIYTICHSISTFRHTILCESYAKYKYIKKNNNYIPTYPIYFFFLTCYRKHT